MSLSQRFLDPGSGHVPASRIRIYARLRLALRPCGNYIWGFAPYPDSGTFLGKSPRDPKKPGRVRYRLSSIDSEQGCRRQPCFLFGADSTAPQPPARPPFIPRSQSCHPNPPLAVHPPASPEPARLPAEILKLRTLSFLAKQFKLYRQLAELEQRM